MSSVYIAGVFFIFCHFLPDLQRRKIQRQKDKKYSHYFCSCSDRGICFKMLLYNIRIISSMGFYLLSDMGGKDC